MNSCTICARKFSSSDLIQTTRNKNFCKECSKSQFCEVTDKKKTEPQQQHKCKDDARPERRKMFTMAELAAIAKENCKKRECYTWKRPLQCPHGGCNRCVSVLDLCAHFQHEHKEVRIIQAVLNGRNPLTTFYPKDISCGSKKCLGLLSVPLPMKGPNHNTTARKPGKQQMATLAVLASRVPAAQLGKENYDRYLEDQDSYVTPEATAIENKEKIIIWVASNVVCHNSCTVAVSTMSEDIKVKYYGQVLQLGNNPNKLCAEGCCLIMHHLQYLGMSQKGLKPLKLDVTVHSEN